MSAFASNTIVGIATAAVYAVIASGLVLTYTTTGVFNFAHGAVGMLAAFAFWQLHVDWGWPTLPAVLVVLFVLAPLAGLLFERLMRGLEGTSETTKLVVSISLLFGMIGMATAVWDPTKPRSLDQFFSGDKISFGGTTLTYHQIIVIVVAVLVAIGLRYLLYRTRVGVAMRAVVDDRPLSQLTGVRTVRVQQLSWMVGVGLAALGGILVASTAGLDATVLSLLIVNAYAAAVFGRLRSLPLTFLGALVVGLGENYVRAYSGGNQYLVGLQLASPVVLLFIVLLVLPNPRLRGLTRTREYFPSPSVRGGFTFCGVVLLAGLMLATTLRSSDLLVYGRMFPYAIIALSLVPLLGFANQVSLCQLSLAGVGAIAYAHYGVGGNPLGLLAAVAAAAIVGALIALPALRLSGIYLALATAAFAVALDRWLFLLPDFSIAGQKISIFGLGSLQVDPLHLGWHFDTPRGQMILSLIVLVILSALVVALRRSAFGRRLVAQRDSEAACATFGMSLVATRLTVFALSAGIAGLGGALAAMQAGSAKAQDFDFTTGLPLFMMVAIGGAGFVSAGLFAGVFLQGFYPLSSVFASWYTKWQSVTTGGVGISMGREPSGAAPQFKLGFRYLSNDPVMLPSTIGAATVVWLLRLAGLYGNWWFVGLLLGVLVAGHVSAEVRAVRRGLTPGWAEPGERATGPPETPLEWVGLTEPWTGERLADVDRVLALDEFGTDAVAGAASGARSGAPPATSAGGR